ncbi:MAG: CoA ester lyase [Gammaproteobacteria bacterium]|nr:CoA ester lyase [Gammaproteobacteria bacterium]NNL99779.1 CoA ester lyase [Gammaproteobacteria bacterium]
MTANRSFLFTPGNHPRKVEKVFGCGADAVILDLEDAVAIAEKPATRAVVVEALKKPRSCRGYIRVNSFDTEFCYDDVVAVVGPWLDGIVLPKVEAPDQLRTVDWLLSQLERHVGLEQGSIDLMPIIETGLGVQRLPAICGSGTRVKRLSFGAGDYHLDMNLVWDRDEAALADVRARLVLASRAANLEPPIDTVVIHINDDDWLRASAERGRMMGCGGKLCIHPNQVAPVNAVFTPTDEEIAHAKLVVEAFEQAEKEGSASIQLDGYFIDYPIVYRAQRLLDLYESING